MPTPAVTLASTMANGERVCVDEVPRSRTPRRRVPHGRGAQPRQMRSARSASGPRQLCADKYNGPARTVKPPVMVMMTRMTSADVPAAVSSRPTCAVRSSGRLRARRFVEASRPYCRTVSSSAFSFCRLTGSVHSRGALIEFGAEEIVLQAAVDDVPRQHCVRRAIAEHEEVRVDAALGHRGAPVAAVALGQPRSPAATRRSPSESSAW